MNEEQVIDKINALSTVRLGMRKNLDDKVSDWMLEVEQILRELAAPNIDDAIVGFILDEDEDDDLL